MKAIIYSSHIAVVNTIKQKSKNSKRYSSTISNYSSIKLDNDAKAAIDFNPVVVNLHNLTINRPSVFSNKIKKIVNGRIIVSYSPELEGEYEIEKISEDIFKLIKL